MSPTSTGSIAADGHPTYQRLAQLARRPQPPSRYAPHFGLVVPPSPYTVPRGWEFVHTAPFEGPSVIAALVKAMGWSITLFDQRDDPDPRSLKGRLGGIDVLGITTYSDSFPYIRAVTDIARRERADRPIILGGPAVTSLPSVIMASSEADYAVLGEGELTTMELLDCLAEPRATRRIGRILGLAWKDEEGKVIINPPRPQMHDLDPVPMQDLSVWPRVQASGEAPEIFASYSRGCPRSCSFCFRAMPRLAFKSAARIGAELRYLSRYRFRFAWWNDLTFLADTGRVNALLDELAGLDFRWCVFTRADHLEEAMLRRMASLGCDLVMFGFESISQSILHHYGKGTTSEGILEAILTVQRAGLKVGGLFIIGSPAETETSLRNVVEFCQRFREVTRVKYLSLLPGTREYRQALRRGQIDDELQHLYFLARERSLADDEFINVSGLPDETLRAAYRAINAVIEVRPYDYRDPQNRYLQAPEEFSIRPLPAQGTDD